MPVGIAKTPEPDVCGRVAVLVVAHDAAVRATADPHAEPDERQAAGIHAQALRARLGRNLAILDASTTPTGRWAAEALGSYLADVDHETRSQAIRAGIAAGR